MFFKKKDNFKSSKYLQKDKLFSHWVKSDGTELQIADLENMVVNVTLKENVSREVVETLEVAKATFVFGYFHYKLFTVSYHYAFLALEAALKIRYKEVTGKESKNYKKAIEVFIEKGIIPEDKKELYDAGRYLRNKLSHLTKATTINPSADILYRTAEMIDALYGGPGGAHYGS